MCRNLVVVTGHRWVPTKGLNCDTHPYMATSAKIPSAVSMDLNFALAAHCHHQLYSKHGRNCLTSSHVWQNFSTVTVQARRWHKNFVMWVTVTEGWWFDQNSTVLSILTTTIGLWCVRHHLRQAWILMWCLATPFTVYTSSPCMVPPHLAMTQSKKNLKTSHSTHAKSAQKACTASASLKKNKTAATGMTSSMTSGGLVADPSASELLDHTRMTTDQWYKSAKTTKLYAN